MDEVLSTFFGTQTILMCLAVYALVFVLRKLLENTAPAIRKAKWYRDVALPVLPIALGASLAVGLIAWVPVEVVGESMAGRGLYGAVCGLLSAFMYGRIRSLLKVG